MNEEENTADPLERIADALEALLPMLERLATPMIIYQTVPTSAPPAAVPAGYRCGSCGTWVMPGTYHTCSGKPWGGSGSPNTCRTGSDQSSAGGFPNTMVWNGIPVTVTLT